MNHANPIMRALLPALISAALTACAADPTSDLIEYAERIKNQQKANIEPLPEFEPFDSFEYSASDLRDPFTPPVFSRTPTAVAQAGGSGIKPDFDRPTEPLEEYPLDSLRMVGTLEQSEDAWALVLDTDDTIHRVQAGNYIGQNHGKIIRVSEFVVELTEIVPDGLGGWMERQASIAISE
jgi:type IV pilus assembly protein PilP